MIDFYFKMFSIDPETVPVEAKRMKYQISDEILEETKRYLNE